MFLEFLRSVGLAAILVASPPDYQFRISQPFVEALFAAQERATRTNDEEFYCIGGRTIQDKVVASSMMKPRQTTTYHIKYDRLANEMRQQWIVYHDRCPPGTIADVHTHPGTRYAHLVREPSDIDKGTWRKTPYLYHLLTYTDGDRHYLILYVRVGDDFVEHRNVETF